jgi:ATP adenylyltransferase
VTGTTGEGSCIFCDAWASGGDDSLVVFRGRLAFVILNLYPYNNGHLMIVPYRHCPDLEQFSAEESLELMAQARRATRALTRAFGAEGFNIGFNLGKAAGAGIGDHIHLHVVPRWVGDTNFMPVLADTKVMPDYLESTYDTLTPLFQEQGT